LFTYSFSRTYRPIDAIAASERGKVCIQIAKGGYTQRKRKPSGKTREWKATSVVERAANALKAQATFRHRPRPRHPNPVNN